MASVFNVVPVFLVLWLVPIWMLSYAQGFSPPLAPQRGADLVPRGSLDAWQTYPSGLFRGKGNRVATIEPGTAYTVTGTKVIDVPLFGDQYYIQLEPKEGSQSNWKSAWVFQGAEGADLPPNLLPPGTVCKLLSSPPGFNCTQSGPQAEPETNTGN